MKKNLFFVLFYVFAFTVSIFPHDSFSFFGTTATFEIEREKKTNKTMAEILEILMDYENTCMHKKCRYHVDNVDEMKVFGDKESGKFHTWTSIKETKNSQYFSSVEVKNLQNGKKKLVSILMTSSQVQRLKDEGVLPKDLSHNTLFDKLDTEWEIIPSNDSSKVSYLLEAKSDNFWVKAAKKLVLKKMNKTADQQMESI